MEREEENLDQVTGFLGRHFDLKQLDARTKARQLLGVIGRAPGVAHDLVRHWWTFLIRGVLAIVFGLMFLVMPGPALAAFIFAFAIWATVDGVVMLGTAIFSRHSWRLAIGGVIGIVIGVLTFYRPEVTALTLYMLVAVWSIVRGIMEVAEGVKLRHEIEGEFWLIFGGLSSIIFGVLLFVLPAAGVLAIAWLIGIYALIYGGFLLSLSFRLHHIDHELHHPPTRELPFGGQGRGPEPQAT